MCRVTAKSESGATENAMGSEMYSAPAGTVTSGMPEKVRTRSLSGTILAEAVETGRAMCTEVKCNGAVPKRFDRCTRSSVPPMDKRTIWRRVASFRSSGAREFRGSGSCCEAAHEPTQWDCPKASPLGITRTSISRANDVQSFLRGSRRKILAKSIIRSGLKR